MSIVEFSLFVPVYNEEEVIKIFISTGNRLLVPENILYEYIFLNDGSTDNTLEILKGLSKMNKRIKIITLSRNFGKEQALTAVIDHATGNAAIPIDCDLQDPPELILELHKKWKEGFDVVLAKRIERTSDNYLKRFTSLFHSEPRKVCVPGKQQV